MSGAYTPALIPVSNTFNCDSLSSTCPICFQLTKSFDEGTIKHIKDLLIPTKGRQAAYDTAYGVFLGYSIGLDGSKYSAVEYRKILAAKMKVDIQNHAAYIAEKIHKLNLSNHSFYFYVLPLNDADTDRVEMMKQIVE